MYIIYTYTRKLPSVARGIKKKILNVEKKDIQNFLAYVTLMGSLKQI